MAKAEEQLSPEEKLLKVIQGDGGNNATPSADVQTEDLTVSRESPAAEVSEETGEAGAAPAPQAAKSTPSEPAKSPARGKTGTRAGKKTRAAPMPESKPKLKLKPATADAEPVREGLAEGKAEQAADGPAGVTVSPEPAVVSGPAVFAGEFGVRTINRCLAAVVAIMILFTAWEIQAVVRGTVEDDEVAPVPLPSLTGGADEVLPPLDRTVRNMARRSFFPAVKKPRPIHKTPELTTDLVLMGFSDLQDGSGRQEAIVVDKETGKMHFMQVEQEIVLREGTYKLVRMTKDRVVFSDGVEEMVVGK